MVKYNALIHSITKYRQLGGPWKEDAGGGRFRFSLLILLLLFCGVSMTLIKVHAQQEVETQEAIAKKIIRFHVIANSDSDEDQALKLKVKDRLVKNLSPLLENAASISDARDVILQNINSIKQTAELTLHDYGCNYPVNVTLEDCYFPLKVYGNCSFPPGVYEALRVQIGAAEGKNWWCVMFPPLCFVDETYSIVDEGTNKKLQHLLTEDEYETLTNKKKPVRVKLKLWNDIKKLYKELKNKKK